MISPKGKKIFAWTMAILMTLMFVVPTAATLARAEDSEDVTTEDLQTSLDELNDKMKELKAEREEFQARIDNAKSEAEKQDEIKKEITSQIDNTIIQINTLDERVTLLNGRIAQKNVEVNLKQQEIDEGFDLFKRRMRAMYVSGGSTNTLQLVLGAGSYSDVLMRAEIVTRVAAHDQELIDRLDVQKRELVKLKTNLEEDKSSVERDMQELENKKAELDAQMKAANDKIQNMELMEQEFMAHKEEKMAEEKLVQEEMNKIYAEINKKSLNTKYFGGNMKWCAPTLSQISCPYGPRFIGGYDFHTGIDITGSGAFGQSIVAANNGTVSVANLSYVPGVGYGMYIIIDHGGGIQTLYGHCSKLLVSVGQYVNQGQQIAQVGSTGWSTGPHVHFEIRVNGSTVNPQGWAP